MRIALLSMSCRGETQTDLARLASALAQRVETHLFLPADSELDGLAPEVALHPLGATRPAAAPWRKLLAMGNPWLHAEHAKRIRRVAPDVVHLLQPHPTHALLIPLLGRPTCLSLHDAEVPSPGRESTLREFMIGRALGLVDQLFVPGAAPAERLLRQGLPAERISILAPANDPLALLATYRQMLSRLHAPSGFPATPA